MRHLPPPPIFGRYCYTATLGTFFWAAATNLVRYVSFTYLPILVLALRLLIWEDDFYAPILTEYFTWATPLLVAATTKTHPCLEPRRGICGCGGD